MEHFGGLDGCAPTTCSVSVFDFYRYYPNDDKREGMTIVQEDDENREKRK